MPHMMKFPGEWGPGEQFTTPDTYEHPIQDARSVQSFAEAVEAVVIGFPFVKLSRFPPNVALTTLEGLAGSE